MLAHRPAPVQISYIGYQGTTGVSAVDYVLSDEWTDPPGQSESNYLETPWRLPQSFFVFDPPVHAPPVGPLPARTNGFVTFGAMNAVWKTTDRTLELWGQVMSEVPGSRIMMLTTRYGPTNDRIVKGLGRCGIAPQRTQLVHRTRPAEFHQRFGSIDLCLDPVPFLGHTTTCDAAWMGCPTISLAGKVYAYRFGAGVMRSLGLADLVTQSPEAFVSTAAGLAHDLDRLEKIRSTLRATMHSSIITNAPLFTRQLEGEFRAMWKIWCNRKLSSR